MMTGVAQAMGTKPIRSSFFSRAPRASCASTLAVVTGKNAPIALSSSLPPAPRSTRRRPTTARATAASTIRSTKRSAGPFTRSFLRRRDGSTGAIAIPTRPRTDSRASASDPCTAVTTMLSECRCVRHGFVANKLLDRRGLGRWTRRANVPSRQVGRLRHRSASFVGAGTRTRPLRGASLFAMRPCHSPCDLRDATSQGSRSDDPSIGAKPEDPHDDLGADPDPEPHVDPACVHERFLRPMPAVAAHERRPPRRQAHLDVLDRVLLVDEDAEALREDPLRIVAVLVRILEGPTGGFGRLDPRKAVGVRRAAARPPDHVELVVVDGERERFDAHRAAPAVEAPVSDLQRAPALERVDHLLEQLLVLRKRLFAAPDEEDELPPGILEPLGMDRIPADVVHQIAHAFLVAGALEQLRQARADASGDHGGDRGPLGADHLRAVDADVDPAALLLADERDVAPDRLQLAIGGGDADPEQRRGFGAGELAPRGQGPDQLPV